MDEPNLKELKFGRPFQEKEPLLTPSILRNIITQLIFQLTVLSILPILCKEPQYNLSIMASLIMTHFIVCQFIFARSINPYDFTLRILPSAQSSKYRLYLTILLGIIFNIAMEPSYRIVLILLAFLFSSSCLLFGMLSKFIPLSIFQRFSHEVDSFRIDDSWVRVDGFEEI